MSEGNTTIGKKTICSKVCKKDKCVKKCETIKNPSKKKIKKVCINIGKKPLCNVDKDGKPNPSFDVSKIKKGGSAGYFGKRPPRLNQKNEPAKLKARKKIISDTKKFKPQLDKLYNKLNEIGLEELIKVDKETYSAISKKYPITNFTTFSKSFNSSEQEVKDKNKEVRKNLDNITNKRNTLYSKFLKKQKQYVLIVNKISEIQKKYNKKHKDDYLEKEIQNKIDKINYNNTRLNKKLKLMELKMKQSIKLSNERKSENIKKDIIRKQKKEERKKKLTIQQRDRRRKAKLKK
tara:strand:+ start:45 stop:917 length:873 start_codon:yes stop_codon:yes gene_type:complete